MLCAYASFPCLHTACLCCLLMLHTHSTFPLQVRALYHTACTCGIPRICMLHVQFACPCCMSLLHVHVACTKILPRKIFFWDVQMEMSMSTSVCRRNLPIFFVKLFSVFWNKLNLAKQSSFSYFIHILRGYFLWKMETLLTPPLHFLFHEFINKIKNQFSMFPVSWNFTKWNFACFLFRKNKRNLWKCCPFLIV